MITKSQIRLGARFQNFDPKNIIGLIILAALIHGLIYVFIVPPWWHYDEAGHFEYSWQVANRPGWPAQGAFDEALRRQIARSMLNSGFYSIQNYTPNLNSPDPVWVGGGSQAGDPPAYYFLTSLPMRLLRNTSVDIQLYSMRLVSLGLFLLTIFISWKILQNLVDPSNPIQWIVLIFMVLLPGLVDTMTAASDDVGAVVAFTSFLWASVLLLKRPFAIKYLAFVILTTLLCFLTQKTAWVAILLLPLVLVLSIFRNRSRKYLWVAISLFFVAGLLVSFRWGDASQWYLGSESPLLSRTRLKGAPLGEYVFRVSATKDGMGQFIPPGPTSSLRDKQITLGVWMWSTSDIEVNSPVIRFAPAGKGILFKESPIQTIKLTKQPEFFIVSMKVPHEARHGWIIITPVNVPVPGVTIYYDGFSLAEGIFDSNPPVFKDRNAEQGIWDQKNFVNLIRNGSAESGWLGISPLVSSLVDRLPIIQGRITLVVAALQDWRGVGWYYMSNAAQLSNTFWSQVATNKVHLPGNFIQYFLRFISLLGLFGGLVYIFRNRRQLDWGIAFIFGLAVLLIWGFAFLRGTPELLWVNPTPAWARYVMPAIFPTVLFLSLGWLELWNSIQKSIIRKNLPFTAVLMAFMATLDLFTFWGLIQYFHPKLLDLGYLVIFLGLPVIFLGWKYSTKEIVP